MTLSRNGQVSIPAATRARWRARRLVVVDLGAHLVTRPATEDPVTALRGRYPGPSTDAQRRVDRTAESADTVRRG